MDRREFIQLSRKIHSTTHQSKSNPFNENSNHSRNPFNQNPNYGRNPFNPKPNQSKPKLRHAQFLGEKIQIFRKNKI